MNIIDFTNAIFDSIKPNATKGIQHQGNWPDDALFGIEYKSRDKQFDVVANNERHLKFFSNIAQFHDWQEKTRKWVAGTDYDFSVTWVLYEWDLGPCYVESGYIGF